MRTPSSAADFLFECRARNPLQWIRFLFYMCTHNPLQRLQLLVSLDTKSNFSFSSSAAATGIFQKISTWCRGKRTGAPPQVRMAVFLDTKSNFWSSSSAAEYPRRDRIFPKSLTWCRRKPTGAPPGAHGCFPRHQVQLFQSRRGFAVAGNPTFRDPLPPTRVHASWTW